MIGFKTKIRYNGGADEGAEFSPRITAFVLIGFERKFSKSVVKLLGEEMMMEPLLWLAWESLKQSGEKIQPFEDWAKKNDPSVELVAPDAPLEQQS